MHIASLDEKRRAHQLVMTSYELTTDGLKQNWNFYSLSANSSFYFIARLRTRRSAKNSTRLCDMLGSEPDLQMHVKNLRGSPPNNWGVKTAYFVTVLILTKLCQLRKNVT